MKNKKYYEEEICKLTRKILNEEELIKIKNIENGLDRDENNPKIKELVECNFAKDFLMEIPKDANNVLVMGINPGGGNKVICRKEKTKNSILFLENLTKEEEKELKIFNGVYVYTYGYHKANYNLFTRINAKAHWAMNGYLENSEIEKMIRNVVNEPYDNKKQNIINMIRKMQKEEREKTRGKCKKDVYVLFGDLLWYSDGKQKNIEKAINIENINEDIKRIMELNIEYHNPKLIVITNAKASHLVEDALKNEKENINRTHRDVLIYKNTPIILASMVSGKRPMDTFSQERLKERIEELYKE